MVTNLGGVSLRSLRLSELIPRPVLSVMTPSVEMTVQFSETKIYFLNGGVRKITNGGADSYPGSLNSGKQHFEKFKYFGRERELSVALTCNGRGNLDYVP